MKFKLSIAIALALSPCFVKTYAQEVYTSHIQIENKLPSEKTLGEVDTEIPLSDLPSTRARPGDIDDGDNPQKIPLADYGITELCAILTILSFYYGYKLKTKAK